MVDMTTVRSGCMIVVVGPSGAGKDSLMALAASHLTDRADISFVQRTVTRAGDAGGEAHRPISPEEFEIEATTGGFAVCWRAHGHGYGVPKATLESVQSGQHLVVNGSRAALADFAAIYPSLAVIQVTAARDCLVARLAARGRETAEEIGARLDRPEPPMPSGLTVYTVDNSGDLAEAGRQFAALVEAIADHHC